jgi:hypothetical protein
LREQKRAMPLFCLEMVCDWGWLRDVAARERSQ